MQTLNVVINIFLYVVRENLNTEKAI